MTKTRKFSTSLPLLSLLGLLLLAPSAFAQVSANLTSRFLARGEYARLEIVAAGHEPEIAPMPPNVPNVKIEGGRPGAMSRGAMGRSFDYSYQFIVSSYEVGRHVIPPIEMMVDGQRTRTMPVEFWVFDPDQLQISQVEAGGRTVTYYASFQTTKLHPYEGETLPIEIKIYVPLELARTVQDWGIPEFERDNVTSWRFEPSDARGQVNILGKPYLSLAYPSTMTPSKSGKVGIGPATLRLTTLRVSTDGYPRSTFEETYLKIPKLEIDATPLPGGAPKGFDNAIGQFEIQSTVPNTELNEGESLAVTLAVRGSGNLDTLHAPKLADEQGWKVYNPITIPRGDERRWLSGTAVFHQGLLPLELKPLLPAFQLVYFDPDDGAYKTTSSEPIALTMKPSTKPLAAAGAPPSLAMPLENMGDILAPLHTGQLTVPAAMALPGWLGHAIGAAVAVILLLKAALMRLGSRGPKDPVAEIKTRELQQIAKIPANDDVEFLKASGRFVERWHGSDPSPELKQLLADRDRLCFRADKPAELLPRGRRDEILKTLRKAAVIVALLFLSAGFAPNARANEISDQAHAAYDAGKYEDAIKLWQSAGDYKTLSADTLYNIGDASYRLGSPGNAALYYRRALLQDSTHKEARQNLRFIERKYGSITVQYSNYQSMLAKIPLSGWKTILWSGLWLTGLGLLVFPATHPTARIRWAATTLLVAGPLLASAGGLGWHYYPNDSVFAPVESRAVVIAPGTAAHTDAARTAPTVIDAPPGSLCQILRVTGKWAYISFATQTRGWVPVSSIEKLIPDAAPGVPKVIKAPDDDSNA
jgi:tetratricopeptide (TPR) repeat protein